MTLMTLKDAIHAEVKSSLPETWNRPRKVKGGGEAGRGL